MGRHFYAGQMKVGQKNRFFGLCAAVALYIGCAGNDPACLYTDAGCHVFGGIQVGKDLQYPGGTGNFFVGFHHQSMA